MFAWPLGIAYAQPKPESVKQVVAIIERFPKLSTFQHYRTLVNDPAAAAKDPKAVAEARDSLNFVRASIPQLMQLLEPGTSVFDYPSLLAIGEIRHAYVGEIPDPFSPNSETKPEPKKGYHIYYGAVGIEFRIEIDDRGSIVQVKKIVRPY